MSDLVYRGFYEDIIAEKPISGKGVFKLLPKAYHDDLSFHFDTWVVRLLCDFRFLVDIENIFYMIRSELVEEIPPYCLISLENMLVEFDPEDHCIFPCFLMAHNHKISPLKIGVMENVQDDLYKVIREQNFGTQWLKRHVTFI